MESGGEGELDELIRMPENLDAGYRTPVSLANYLSDNYWLSETILKTVDHFLNPNYLNDNRFHFFTCAILASNCYISLCFKFKSGTLRDITKS